MSAENVAHGLPWNRAFEAFGNSAEGPFDTGENNVRLFGLR